MTSSFTGRRLARTTIASSTSQKDVLPPSLDLFAKKKKKQNLLDPSTAAVPKARTLSPLTQRRSAPASPNRKRSIPEISEPPDEFSALQQLITDEDCSFEEYKLSGSA